MEARLAAALGTAVGAVGGPERGPPLLRLGLTALRCGGRRLRHLRVHPAGPRTWLFLGGSLGLCDAVGLDPSLGVVGAIAGGLPQSPLLPGGARGAVALLLFASGLWLLLGLILRLGLRLLLGGTAGVLGGPGPPPRLWMALVRMFEGRRPRLHSFQGVLPPLPLPPLHDTVSRYLASLEPLGPGGGQEGAAALARSFEGGSGPRLQRWLRLRSWLLPSYLSELWEEHIYLRARSPLPINSSYYVMDLLGPPPTHIQAARAANATFALLSFRALLEGGGLPPVLFRGALPTCTAPYERIFGCSRIPGERVDRLRRFGSSAHVVVLRGGTLYKVTVMRGGRPLPPRELQEQFRGVLEDGGGTNPPEEAVGVLTAGDRPPWALARAALRAGGGPNVAALQAVDSAAFVVAMDPPAGGGRGDPPSAAADGDGGGDPPHHWDAEAKALLHGRGYDRWFDKPLTLVVFGGGRAGLSVEQAGGDPHVVGHLWEFTLAMDVVELGYEVGGDCRGGVVGDVPPPQRLHWDVPEECRGAMGAALGVSRGLAQDLELHVFVAPPPSPGPPRRRPHDLIQTALQVALLRERGAALTMEAVPTRLFLEGRTEGARGCTPQGAALEAAMGDPTVGRARRRALLEEAVGRQRALRRAAMTGGGLERHLQALGAAAIEMGESAPFLHQALTQPWAMASSSAPRPQPPLLPPELQPMGGGFGPPHDDGYGVSFTVTADAAVVFHISCKASSPKTDAHRFAGLIRTALLELEELGELGGELE